MTNKEPWEAWSPEKVSSFQEDFLAWYEREKRNLPWRANTDAYRIWISEIMLQQTRVDTVIDILSIYGMVSDDSRFSRSAR